MEFFKIIVSKLKQCFLLLLKEYKLSVMLLYRHLYALFRMYYNCVVLSSSGYMSASVDGAVASYLGQRELVAGRTERSASINSN